MRECICYTILKTAAHTCENLDPANTHLSAQQKEKNLRTIQPRNQIESQFVFTTSVSDASRKPYAELIGLLSMPHADDLMLAKEFKLPLV